MSAPTIPSDFVSRAVQLSGSYSGIVYEFEEATQTFHARATHHITPEHLETLRESPIRLGEDNEYVYQTLLGVSDEAYRGLVDSGEVGAAYPERILLPGGT